MSPQSIRRDIAAMSHHRPTPDHLTDNDDDDFSAWTTTPCSARTATSSGLSTATTEHRAGTGLSSSAHMGGG